MTSNIEWLAVPNIYVFNLVHFGMFDVLQILTCNDAIYHSQEEVFMQCPKCRGTMYAEKFYDFVRSFDAWKCTCCGEVVDPVIIANRSRTLAYK